VRNHEKHLRRDREVLVQVGLREYPGLALRLANVRDTLSRGGPWTTLKEILSPIDGETSAIERYRGVRLLAGLSKNFLHGLLTCSFKRGSGVILERLYLVLI